MNYNPNEQSSASQKKLIKAHLESGKRITPLSALRDFNCYNFSARLSELKQTGFPIESIWIVTDTGKRIKEHYMGNVHD